MTNLDREQILQLGAQAHDWTEHHYRSLPALKGTPDWPEKQRILLADMSLHLLRTALISGEIDRAELRRNLYAILSIADQFLPEHELKAVADQLYREHT